MVHQPCHRKSKRNVSGKTVKGVHGQDGGVHSDSPRIGTLLQRSDRVPSVNTFLGCQAGSLVWLMLDVNSFVEVIARKTFFDKNSGAVLKYNVWLDSDCLVEADEDTGSPAFQGRSSCQGDCSWRGTHCSFVLCFSDCFYKMCACVTVPLTIQGCI